MRAPALVAIIAALHILGITAFVFIQGCGTTRPTLHSAARVDPPPAPPMPPRAGAVPTAVPPVLAAPPAPAPAPTSPAPANAIRHTVQRGDTLSGIASRYGVRTRELIEYNALAHPDRLELGQTILVPPHGRAAIATPSAPAPRPARPAPTVAPAAGGTTYTVLAGDSLSVIASRHGVKVADLRSANNLSGDLIRVGQKLVIPGGAAPAAAPQPAAEATPAAPVEPAPRSILNIEVPDAAAPDLELTIPSAGLVPQNKPIPYTVVAGDTLDEIAKLFIVSKAEIMELNGLGPNDELVPGQKINIPPSDL